MRKLEKRQWSFKEIEVKKVNAISVNEITTSRQRARFYEEPLWAGDQNPMEGAASHYYMPDGKDSRSFNFAAFQII